MESVYKQFGDDIVKCEYKTVNPDSTLNLNTPNNYTTFKIDHGDAFYDARIMYHIEGELVKKSNGGAYDANTKIKLVDNFPAFLFSRIELKKHNTTIDSVDFPGITSTVKGLLTYAAQEKIMLPLYGFSSTFEGGGKFEAMGPVGHLGLGFFDSLHYPMFKGGFEITFTRAEDSDSIFHWKSTDAGSTNPEDGKITIKSFVLRVPIVEYSYASKIQLIDGLKQLSDKGQLKYPYYQWQCIEKKGVYGSSFTFDITNSYRNVYNPRFVIVALQTNRTNSQKANPSQFDSENIKNASVQINGVRYPQEMQNINIINGRWRTLYDMFLRFRLITFKDSSPITDPNNFITFTPILVIDTHLHPINTDRSRNDIQIDLDFNNAIASPTASTGTTAYVIVMSGVYFAYDIVKNLITFQ